MVCGNNRIKRNRVFRDLATTGKSTMGWFYGFKLHMVTEHFGRWSLIFSNCSLSSCRSMEHSRHRAVANFMTNIVSGIIAYNFMPKKPSLKYETVKTNQLALFY
jgi:hypothetical protein